MNYNIILIHGRQKTGKTKLARLLATLIDAVLLDKQVNMDQALIAHLAFPLKPLVFVTTEKKPPKAYTKGSSLEMLIPDISIHTPDLSTIDRYGRGQW